jgi:hypothetical protein
MTNTAMTTVKRKPSDVSKERTAPALTSTASHDATRLANEASLFFETAYLD